MSNGLNGLLPSLVMLASGCATWTKGGSQTVTVDTDPSGATCTMRRDARVVAIVNPTPGSVPVAKGQGTVAVGCMKQGYLEAAGNLASGFQAMPFGGILVGGITGIAVDAAIEQRTASARVAGRD